MEREEMMKELADIRAQVRDCMMRLNAFSDLRDDANADEITETQEGVAQTFEIAVASEEAVTNVEVALAEVYEMIVPPEEGGEA